MTQWQIFSFIITGIIIAFIWLRMWYKISEGQTWGLLIASSPLIVFIIYMLWLIAGDYAA